MVRCVDAPLQMGHSMHLAQKRTASSKLVTAVMTGSTANTCQHLRLSAGLVWTVKVPDHLAAAFKYHW
jgi:hypothetical protein